MLQLRRERGITQKQVARALGVTEQTVRNWEHGRIEPRFTVAQFKVLCNLLGKTLDEMPSTLAPNESRPPIES